MCVSFFIVDAGDEAIRRWFQVKNKKRLLYIRYCHGDFKTGIKTIDKISKVFDLFHGTAGGSHDVADVAFVNSGTRPLY